MLTDTVLRSQVDQLWDKLWTGGLTNPLDAIEQFSYLLFMKQLDDAEMNNEQIARRRGQKYKTIFPKEELRWSYWTKLKAEVALKFVKDEVFPYIKKMSGKGSSFELQMENAEFKINRPSLLIEACKVIDQMQISHHRQDVQGDLYEHLLSYLNTAGRNGQFRTPRHIIRMMVQMLKPKATERICDPAAGTCGFLVSAYQYILETHTSPNILEYDAEGVPHNLAGDLLKDKERTFLQNGALTGYDNDSGMTMLRIGSMNLMLHGIKNPNFRYTDALGKDFKEAKRYDVVLANPPFKGAIDSLDVNPTLPTRYKKTELLFLHLFLRLLEMGGRCAAISPDGVLFGSSNAHVDTRKLLIEQNRLEAVVSMPSGVFKPYAGVSTAVLIFTRGGTTDRIWFYDMEHDGLSLDDKRQKVSENDIPDILKCWDNRTNARFAQKRAARLEELKKEIAPMKSKRLKLQAEINRLTFENAIAPADDEPTRAALEKDQQKLDELQEQIAPLQREINQLSRQFWVTKEQVKATKYDLSASRYRRIEQDEVFYDEPQITLERLVKLENVMATGIKEIGTLL
ncbi:MAG TPA: class I SAM-dependent DNA methyltransferase [Pyrinomonadaceae bacterium]|nr:class I SAM-dependent DNA methyltransferase [Pyrinomonadaceae bacterium]